jgi:hypothetical protein
MFSSLTVSGLFLLTRSASTEGNLFYQSLGNQLTTTLNGLHFTYYNSELTCTDGQSVSAKIRVRSDSPAALLPNNTAAYLTGTAYIDTVEQESYIDATCVKFVKGSSTFSLDATSLSTYFDCLGTVCGDSYVLDDEDASVVFPVLVRVCILDDIKSTQLMYEFSSLFGFLSLFFQVHVLRAKPSLDYNPCPLSGHDSARKYTLTEWGVIFYPPVF